MTPEEVRQELGRAITDRMFELGLNQRELAEKASISVATIRKLQNGADHQYGPAGLKRLAAALGMDPHLVRLRAGGVEAPEKPEPPPSQTADERLTVIEATLSSLDAKVDRVLAAFERLER